MTYLAIANIISYLAVGLICVVLVLLVVVFHHYSKLCRQHQDVLRYLNEIKKYREAK